MFEEAIGATLRVNNNIAGDQTILLASPVTLGRLFLGDANASHSFTLQSSGGALTFANLSGPAVLSKTTGTNDTLDAALALQSSLVVTNTTAAQLVFAGNLTGPGLLTKAGAGPLVLQGSVAHTGGTTIAGGTLALGPAASLAGALELKSGATLDVSAKPGGYTLSAAQSLSCS